MDELIAIKKRLKKWEGEFLKENERKPNKEDICYAPQDIRDAYKEYGMLRKKSQNVTSANNANEEPPVKSVWGSHLNKSNSLNKGSEWLAGDKDISKSTDTENCEEENKPSFTASLREKLLEKALSTSDKKVNNFKSGFSRTTSSIFGANRTSRCESALKSLSDQQTNKNSSQSLILENCVEDKSESDEIEIKSSIFAKGLKATKKATSKRTVSNGNSNTDSFMKALEQRKSSQLKLQNKYANYNLKAIDTLELKHSENLNSSSVDADHLNNEENDVKIIESNNRPFGMFSSSKEISDDSTSVIKTKPFDKNNGSSNKEDTTSYIPESTLSKEQSNISTDLVRKNISINKSNQEVCLKQNLQVKYTNISSNLTSVDNGIEPKRGRKRKVSNSSSNVSTPKRRNIVALKSPVTPVNEDSNSMMVEVSWRPNSRQDNNLMIDLDSSIQDAVSDEPKSDNDSEIVKKPKKYGKARSTAPKMSNDNYIRLNMKAKKYQRKGKITSGPAYKRMQWKLKMKARSESFGSGKCFKCGQEGHWANKCKGGGTSKSFQKTSIEPATDNPVDDADFPTMSQAFNMARGIKGKSVSKKVKTEVETTDTLDDVNNDDGVVDIDEEPDVIRTAYEPMPPPPPVEPLYCVGDGEPLPEPTKDVYQGLSKFGFTSFRPGQEKAIMRVLCGKSALVVLSTGAGKSLCYQLPAYLYAQKGPSITLVISPLVSLMEDQVSRLPAGVKGACLHTNMSQAQREKVADDVSNGKIHFLLISPEAMAGGKAGGCLPGINKLPPIAFACIDEAHCLSEWSHHFRPSYLRICKILRDKFGVKCFLGLTATATMVTAASVAQHLGIHDYKDATIRGSPVPPNLHLSVSRDEDKDEALITLLQGERLSKCDSIIIYCTRREQTDRIATLIRTCMQEMKKDRGPELDESTQTSSSKKGKGKKAAKPKKHLDAECYHAGMSAAQRKRIQNAFMSGRLWVVVATVAFGMGLDKPDVRAVIHYNLPKSFESYVQEIGRAGRDGKAAQCHLFLDPLKQDMNELKRHIYSNTVDRYVIKKLVRRVFTACRCRELHERHNQAVKDFDDEVVEGEVPSNESEDKRRLCPGHERAVSIQDMVQTLDMKEEGIATLLCYLELHPKKWIENFQNVYGTCTIQCYGGPRQLQEIAKKCPPVAIAIAKEKKLGVSHSKSSKLEFPVVEIADSMGWDSGPVKRELKLLQWNFDPSGMKGPSKSGVLVEFSDLCFHLRSPGDLKNEEIDDIVCFLADRIETQERTELFQLQDFHDTLHKVSHKNVWMCSEVIDNDRSLKLKGNILEYFDRQPDIDQNKITKLSFAREISADDPALINDKIMCENADYVRGDIRGFIQMYSSEHQLTGRSIARVFHGIPSPCFPAEVWGRVRRFWRCHMNTDFNQLRKMATQELIRLK